MTCEGITKKGTTKVPIVHDLDKSKDTSSTEPCGKKLIPFYENIRNVTPSKNLTFSETYELIKTGFKAETEYIQAKHAEGILEGFKTIEKNTYQADKIKLLSGATFSFSGSRETGNKTGEHSRIINLDIDENTLDELRGFFVQISTGQNKGLTACIEAAARSVSGAINGAMWVNIRIEIPTKLKQITPKLKTQLRIKDKDLSQSIEAIHKAYHKAFTYIFLQDGIKIGSAKDIKRLRYISHDPDIYTNLNAERYTLASLEAVLREISKQEIETNYKPSTAGINTSNAFLFAEQFAERQGYSFVENQRHFYRVSLGFALNILGVPLDDAEDFVFSKYGRRDGKKDNSISSAYEKYRNEHGNWLYLLAPKAIKPIFEYALKKKQRVDSLANELVNVYAKNRYIDLEAPPAAGKNYAFVHEVAPRLMAVNGCKMVIVCSNNIKSEKDANQYKLPYITGEALKSAPSKKQLWDDVLKSPVVLCNQNKLPELVNRFEAIGERLNVVFDESQTLVDGMSYKNVAPLAMAAAKRIGETITLMSGTPKPYFTEIGFKRVAITQEERPKIIAKFRERLKNKGLTALAHCKDTDFSQKRVIIQIQSKSTIRELRDLLIEKGIAEQDEIVLLYSAKPIKQSKAYKLFVEAGKNDSSFAERVKIVLCTSFVNEGLDFYEQNGYDLEFVTVEQKGTISVDDLVQFPCRDRSKRSRALYVYAYFRKDDESEGHFNQVEVFKEQLALYTKFADGFNDAKYSKHHFTSEREKFNLIGDHSGFTKYIYHDPNEGKYKVNVMAIMGAVEQLKNRHTTTQRAMKEIQERFPYVQVIDERKTGLVDTMEDKLAAQDIRAKDESKKQKAKETIANIYNLDKETFFQAIGMTTDDSDIKRSIVFSENRKEAVTGLISKYEDVFGDYFDEAEYFIKSHIKLSSLMLEPSEVDTILLDPKSTIISKQKLSVFVSGLRLHLALYIATYTASEWKFSRKKVKALTVLQWADIERLNQVAESVDGAALANDGRLTSKQIFEAVKQPYKRQKVRPYGTQNKAVKLVNSMFETNRITDKDSVYEIGERRTLIAFLTDLKLNEKNFILKLHNLLIINTEKQTDLGGEVVNNSRVGVSGKNIRQKARRR